MNLSDLLKDYNYKLISGDLETEVSGIELNSNNIKENNAFICIKGANADGHSFIKSAVDNGASCVVVETVPADIDQYPETTFVQVEDTHDAVGHLASNFYGNPGEELTVIGITGTKGKTSVTQMIKKILQDNGIKCASIGTLGIEYDDVHIHQKNTTPDAVLLQKSLRDILDHGYTHVVMEASSQGFKLKRMNGLKFDIGVFLNIDQDHIGKNEHKDFDEYLDCKKEIFNQSKKVIVNSNDKLWNYLTPAQKEEVVTFSTASPADYYATNIVPVKDSMTLGTRFDLEGRLSYPVTLSVPAEFNVSNALAGIAVADQLGLDMDKVLSTVAEFQPNGRAELIREALDYDRIVLVDFAHNKLSIESVLKGLRPYHPERLISMFGLHWNETLMRRYDQGLAAGKYSDYTILTSDHKGPVSFEEISRDVEKGLEDSQGDYTIIEDRKEAIIHALENSTEKDIVVLFGMGNERTQIIDGVETPFSEKEIVLDYLKSKAQE